MEGVESLKKSQYLVDVYVAAYDCWDNFKRSQNPEFLRSAARTLCEGHYRLEADNFFWAALYELPNALEEYRHEVMKILNDLDSFLVEEEKILRSPTLNIGDEMALRLTTDMALAINLVRDFPTAQSIENLRNRARSLQEAVCEAREAPDERRESFFRGTRNVGRGLLYISGGVAIVANLTVLGVAAPVAWASALSGVGLMVKQVEDFTKEVIPQRI